MRKGKTKSIFVMLFVCIFIITPVLGITPSTEANENRAESNEQETNEINRPPTEEILQLVEQLQEDGAFKNRGAAQSLKAKLNTVIRFEQKGNQTMAEQQFEQFLNMLEQRLSQGHITAEAYEQIFNFIYLIEEPADSLVIVKDGQAEAVVVTSDNNIHINDTEIHNKVLRWGTWNGSGSQGYSKPTFDVSRTGNASLLLQNMTFGSVTQNVPAQTGTFELSAYYMTPEAENSTINVTLNLRDENNVVVKRINSEEILTSETTGEWAKITLQGEITENVDRHQVVITVKGQQEIPVYVDDVRFTQEDQSYNLLKNPGFEEILIDQPVSGWSTWNDSGSNGYANPNLGIAHTGNASVSFQDMIFGSISQTIQAQPGSFELSAYYMTPEKENSTINITLNLRDENNVVVGRIRSEEILTSETTGEWTKITLQGTIPENENVDRHQVVITVKGQQKIPVYVDDVYFTQEDQSHNPLNNPGFEEIQYNNPAAILVEYVKKSTGAKLPIKTIKELEQEPVDGTKIYIGKHLIEDPSINEGLVDLSNEGFFIRAEDEYIAIVGNTQLGTQNGVYDFLERYVGVRWLLPGEAWEDVPQKSNLWIPKEDVREEPAFELRRIYDAEQDWTLANKLQFSSAKYRLEVPKDQYRFMHNLYTLFPVEKYGKTNPEFYPNGTPPAPGVYSRWQPCFTADGTIDVAVSGILEYFNENPDVPYFSLGVNDTRGHCESDPNHPHYPGKINSIGVVDMSDIYYAWVNEVVERVLEVYPDKKFGVLAYQQVMDPPSFPLHSHVIPIVTKDRLAWIDEEIKEIGHRQLDDWYEVSDQVAWYDYMYGTFYALPRVYPHRMAEDIQYAYTQDVYGTHAEMRFNVGDGPKAWLFAKLQWNPDQDVDALLDEWYVRAVGQEAAPELAAYFELWEEFWTVRMQDTPWFKAGKGDTYLSITDATYLNFVTDEDIEESNRLLASVVAKAQTEQQKERAKQLQRMFEYYEASILSYPRQVESPENASDALAMLEHFWNGESYKQKRYDLIEEFNDELALKFYRPLRVDWTGWNGFQFWALVDYIKENETNGGPVTDRINDLIAEQENLSAKEAAKMLLKVAENVLPTITTNSSYEEGNENAPAWIFWDPNNSATIKRVEGTAHTGESSVSFEGAERSGTYQIIDVQPGFMATQMHYYTPPGTVSEGGVRIVASPENKDGKTLVEYISPTIPLSNTAGEWASVGLFENIPAEINGEKVTRVLLNAQVIGAPDAQVYLDDVVFYQND